MIDRPTPRPDRGPDLTVVVASNYQLVMVWRAARNHHERNAAVIRADIWERTRMSIDRLLCANHCLISLEAPISGPRDDDKGNNGATPSVIQTRRLRQDPRRSEPCVRSRLNNPRGIGLFPHS